MDGGGAVIPSHDAIADAVHTVMVALFEGAAWQVCGCYALVGAGVLTGITGRRHLLQCGRLEVATDGNAGFVLERDDRDRCWHAWIVAPDDPVEIIDLSARHWSHWAALLGARWKRPVQRYLWTTPAGLERERVRYTVDAELTRATVADYASEMDAWGPMIREMVRLLTAKGTTR